MEWSAQVAEINRLGEASRLAERKDGGRNLIRNWVVEPRNGSIVKDGVLETRDVHWRHRMIPISLNEWQFTTIKLN